MGLRSWVRADSSSSLWMEGKKKKVWAASGGNPHRGEWTSESKIVSVVSREPGR